MADVVNGSNGNGEQRRTLEAAAENATLKLVARWMMVAGVPA